MKKELSKYRPLLILCILANEAKGTQFDIFSELHCKLSLCN